MSRRSRHEPRRNADLIRRENISINPGVCVGKRLVNMGDVRGGLPDLQLAEITGLIFLWSSTHRVQATIFTLPLNCLKVVRLISRENMCNLNADLNARGRCWRLVFLCAWMISCARCRLPVVTFATLRGVKLWIYVGAHPLLRNTEHMPHFTKSSGPPLRTPRTALPCSRPCDIQQVGSPGCYLSDGRA